MNEKELKEKIKRGGRAKQLLEDPMVQEFLKELRETIYHNIRTSHYKDLDDREDLYKMLKVSDEFERLFILHINTGKLAQSKFDQMKEKVTGAVTKISDRLKHLP